MPPLPGTAAESAALLAMAKDWNWPVQAYLGAEATEEQLRACVRHDLTPGHARLLPDTDRESADAAGERGSGGMSLRPRATRHAAVACSKNPMHRSGLALAGAQTTLETWKRGEVPPMRTTALSPLKRLADSSLIRRGWSFFRPAIRASAKLAQAKAFWG